MEEWVCESNSYDEETGICLCDGNQCSGSECPYDMYITE